MRLVKYIVVILLLMMTMTLAATTWIQPTAGGAVSTTTQILNVTETGGDDITNVTFSYSTNAGSTWTFIANVENASFQDTDFNITWSTTGIKDQPDFQLNATAFTDAAGGTFADSVAVKLINIDNTNPTSTYASPTPADGATVENISLTLKTASDTSLVNCTFNYLSPIGSTTSSEVTASGNTCTVLLTNVPDGAYQYDFTSTDGLNFSFATNRTVIIDSTEGSIVPQIVAAEAITKKEKTTIIVIAAIILLLLWDRSRKK